MKTLNETIVMDGEIKGSKSKFQGGKKGRKRLDFDPEEAEEIAAEIQAAAARARAAKKS